MASIFVSTAPFGLFNRLPYELLADAGAEVRVNPLGRKVTETDLEDLIGDAVVLIAGTERISSKVFDAAPNLKLICRVGVGLDGVDLLEARRREILVSYTPLAPAPAVAELTIGLMLNLARGVHRADEVIRSGGWERVLGRRLSEMTIGVVGCGRIGGRVIRRLASFGSPRILVNDINPVSNVTKHLKLELVGKEVLFKESDLITLHVPLTPMTNGFVNRELFKLMKNDSFLINTARGEVVNERDLFEVLSKGNIGGAAIDVFEHEPYSGPLTQLGNCVLTAHMGSMSQDCRSRMEIEATEECCRFLKGLELTQLVPDTEYGLREMK